MRRRWHSLDLAARLCRNSYVAMPVSNADIAAQLNKIADLLDIEASNPFRIRAYRRAARLVGSLPSSVTDMLAAGANLDELPGIGRDLASKITILAQGKSLPMLEGLEREMPPSITQLLAIPGLGPRRVHVLHEVLGIDDVEALNIAARAGKLRNVPGFGVVLEAKILRTLAAGAAGVSRTLLSVAEQVAGPLLAHLRQTEGVHQAEIAGSYRRRCETVGDIDIVVASESGESVMHSFTDYKDAAEVIERGKTRATVRLRSGLQVDLRVVSEASFGAALCYFTGAKVHNIALRQIAVGQGLKLNEYGLYEAGNRIAGRTEEELYSRLGLRFIPPELREDQGEIDAARQNRLPRLISLRDIQGDLHVHTNAADGRSSLRDLAMAAKARGYGYLAITDHSRRLTIAHGFDAKRLAYQADEIDRINEELAGFTLLKSIEVDILEDGTLDLPEFILGRLDFVVGAIHSRLDLSEAKQTERIMRAMDQRCINILAHPTGRLLGQRPACAVDMERIMRGAVERGCFLEVNAQPHRLDLNDAHCRLAKTLGLKLAISSDAHSDVELSFMSCGVDQARRGWLEATDVLNARPLPALLAMLRQRR